MNLRVRTLPRRHDRLRQAAVVVRPAGERVVASRQSSRDVTAHALGEVPEITNARRRARGACVRRTGPRIATGSARTLRIAETFDLRWCRDTTAAVRSASGTARARRRERRETRRGYDEACEKNRTFRTSR